MESDDIARGESRSARGGRRRRCRRTNSIRIRWIGRIGSFVGADFVGAVVVSGVFSTRLSLTFPVFAAIWLIINECSRSAIAPFG